MKSSYRIEPRSSYKSSGKSFNVPVKFALPIINLMEWIAVSLDGVKDESYERGKQSGEDLLGGLNNGTISMQSLDHRLQSEKK